jgi:hypothetical protein
MDISHLARASLLVGALCAGPSGQACAATYEISLVTMDEYVMRRITVTKADKTVINDVLRIQGYDAATKSFRLETASGGVTLVAADSLTDIRIAQTLRESSPQAQQCPWKVYASYEQEFTAKVPAAKLDIQPKGMRVDDAGAMPIAPGAVVEVGRIAYEKAADSFSITLRGARYERRMVSCPSGPGDRKGLQ